MASDQEDQVKIKGVKIILTRVKNIVTWMGGRFQNAPTSAYIVIENQDEKE
jgi:hypothetical protein